MKVIETDGNGKPTGWQQGKNKMFFNKLEVGHFYLVEKPFKKRGGSENIVVAETFLKFKDAKRSLMR